MISMNDKMTKTIKTNDDYNEYDRLEKAENINRRAAVGAERETKICRLLTGHSKISMLKLAGNLSLLSGIAVFQYPSSLQGSSKLSLPRSVIELPSCSICIYVCARAFKTKSSGGMMLTRLVHNTRPHVFLFLFSSSECNGSNKLFIRL